VLLEGKVGNLELGKPLYLRVGGALKTVAVNSNKTTK